VGLKELILVEYYRISKPIHIFIDHVHEPLVINIGLLNYFLIHFRDELVKVKFEIFVYKVTSIILIIS
jgi:hypothetical protein